MVTTGGAGGAGVGDGVGEGVVVGDGVGLAAGVVELGPQAARPTAAIAEPMMVVRFMSAFTHSTGTGAKGYIHANASNVSTGDRPEALEAALVGVAVPPRRSGRRLAILDGARVLPRHAGAGLLTICRTRSRVNPRLAPMLARFSPAL